MAPAEENTAAEDNGWVYKEEKRQEITKNKTSKLMILKNF